MKTKMKKEWHKPECTTIILDRTEREIMASACSWYSDCHMSWNHLESVPGKPPVETM